MTKNDIAKLDLSEGYTFGTYQAFKKNTSKKGSLYGRHEILVGKSTQEFFADVPEGVTFETYAKPAWAVRGQLVCIKRASFSLFAGYIKAECDEIVPVIDK